MGISRVLQKLTSLKIHPYLHRLTMKASWNLALLERDALHSQEKVWAPDWLSLLACLHANLLRAQTDRSILGAVAFIYQSYGTLARSEESGKVSNSTNKSSELFLYLPTEDNCQMLASPARQGFSMLFMSSDSEDA